MIINNRLMTTFFYPYNFNKIEKEEIRKILHKYKYHTKRVNNLEMVRYGGKKWNRLIISEIHINNHYLYIRILERYIKVTKIESRIGIESVLFSGFPTYVLNNIVPPTPEIYIILRHLF